MNRNRKTRLSDGFTVLLLAFLFVRGSVSHAQEPGFKDLVEPFAQGSVNWTKGTVRATGIGFPPDNITNPARGRIMAERAAFAVALRNLLEVVKGVRVDATTVVENFMVKSDVVRTRVSGFVKGARTIRKQASEDGSVELTVEVPLWGDSALTDLLVDEKHVGTQPLEPVSSPEGYTELILDARGFGVSPTVFPVIADEDGNIVYGPELVERDDVVQNGMGRYVKADEKMGLPEEDGKGPTLLRVKSGRRPLKLKVAGKGKKVSVNFVISSDDAKKIKSSDKIADYLRQGRVTIVVDFLIGGTEGHLLPDVWSVVSEK